MKITPGQIDAFLKKPAAEIILLHGADAGRVGDAAARLARAAGGETGTVTYDAAEVIKDPALLHDASAALGLFGGGQAVRVRDAGDKLTKTMKEFLAGTPGGNRVVVEAGDLAFKSSLRKLFEDAPNAAAVQCPAPETKDLAQLAKSLFHAAGRTLTPEAEILLADRLPRDSLAAKSETEKLLLWLGSDKSCGVEAVQLLIGDGAEDDLDAPALAAADGDVAGVVKSLRRLSSSGESAIGVLRIAQRHFQRLHQARAEAEAGVSAEDAVAQLRPPVFWKRRRQVEAQVKAWGFAQLERALGMLTEAESQCKSNGFPEDAVAAHALFTIACAVGGARAGRRP